MISLLWIFLVLNLARYLVFYEKLFQLFWFSTWYRLLQVRMIFLLWRRRVLVSYHIGLNTHCSDIASVAWHLKSWQLDCLFNRLIRLTTNKTSELSICEGNLPVISSSSSHCVFCIRNYIDMELKTCSVYQEWLNLTWTIKFQGVCKIIEA